MNVSIVTHPIRRRALQLASVVAAAAVGLVISAMPANAEVNESCVTRAHMFRAAMAEARFYFNAADSLEAAGNFASADLATAEANYYLEQASNAFSTLGLC